MTTKDKEKDSKTLRLLVKVDMPAKEVVMNVPKTATYGDLRALIGKEFEIKENVDRYLFLSVALGKDVIELGKGSTGDKEVLVDSGVVDSSVIFARAPSDIKPPRPRPKKKKGKEGKEEKSVSADKDRYKGITVKNIYSKLSESKDTKKRKILLEFIDIYATEIFKNKSALNSLPKETLVEILKSDKLNCKEGEVFEAVTSWSKNAVKEKKEDEKKIMAELLPLVRFPNMTTQDIAVSVSPSGLLDPNQILDLFTFLGMKGSSDKKPKLPKSLEGFNSKERKGRKPPCWFKFDQNMKHTSLILSNEGLTVSSNNTSYYQPIFGDIELNEGVHEWEIELTQFHVNAYSCMIGVVPTSYTSYTSSQMIGYSGHIPGWSYAAGQGQKYYNGSQTAYGRTCAQGDVVRCRLDMDKKNIEYFVNDQSQGVAYTGITGPVRPAMSLYGTNTVTLRFPK